MRFTRTPANTRTRARARMHTRTLESLCWTSVANVFLGLFARSKSHNVLLWNPYALDTLRNCFLSFVDQSCLIGRQAGGWAGTHACTNAVRQRKHKCILWIRYFRHRYWRLLIGHCCGHVWTTDRLAGRRIKCSEHNFQVFYRLHRAGWLPYWAANLLSLYPQIVLCNG